MSDRAKIGTRAVWAGEQEYLMQGATQVPVVHSVSFGYRDVDEWREVALGKKRGHIYSRNTNPTVQVFEDKVQDLENAEAATSASTGMGIISSTLFALLSPDDRVVSVKDTYGGTNVIFREFLPRFRIQVTLCDTTDHEQIEKRRWQRVVKFCIWKVLPIRQQKWWTSLVWPLPPTGPAPSLLWIIPLRHR